MVFTNSTPVAIDDVSNIFMTFKLLTNWVDDYMKIELLDGTTSIGSQNINSTIMDTNTILVDRTIVINPIDFTAGASFDTIKLTCVRYKGGVNTTKVSFQLDDFKIQIGGDTIISSKYFYATDTVVDTTNFDKNLTVAEDTAQKAFQKINDIELSEMDDMSNMTASKITPIDADNLTLWDSVAGTFKKLTWANLKATLKTYFDSVYQVILVSGTNIKTINTESLLGSGDITITAGGTADIVTVDTTNFDKNLSVADDTVQKALETLDELVGGLAGSVKEFDFVAETVCVVNHNYNVQYPRITCIDTNDEEFIPWKIDYVSLTQTIITFTEATTCKIVTDTGATATVQPNTIGNEELTSALSERETMATDVIDWSTSVAKIKTIAGATTLTDSNMPSGTKTQVIELHIDGDFAITFPAYWVWKGGVYDGTVSNMIVASCLNGNSGSEIVNYIIVPNA